jgi:hypothetical protein
VADKNKSEKLTVYLTPELDERFREEAERNFRSFSDHMVAILTERYGRRNGKHTEKRQATPV